jgi:hypothetical protein
MRSEPSSKAAPLSTLDRRRRQLLAGIASGAGLASALSALSACGGGGPDDDATLRAVNATMDIASIDVQFNDWLFAGAVAYGGAASSYARRNLWFADQTLTDRDPNHRLGAYESLSAYADVNGDGRLRITPAGRTDLVLFDSASIGLTANQVATLVVCPAPGAARVAVAVLSQGLPAYVLTNTVVTVIPEAKLP